MEKMLLDIVLLVTGTALVLWGADRFIDSASAIARRWNISEMVIGLTVVAVGTSLPEFVVSFFSAVQDSGDMSVGNIVGSNIFNTLMIVGFAALMKPILIPHKILLHRDMLLSLGAAFVLLAMCSDSQLNRWDGIVLLVFFAMFMGYAYYIAMHSRRYAAETEGGEDAQDKHGCEYSIRRILVLLVMGLAALVGGGQVMVHSASALALACGMSEGLVGLTILAAGTSLPELATSVVAAHKGSKDLALGNVLGSNIFNICLVLGSTSLLRPIEVTGMTRVDWAVLIGSGAALLLYVPVRHRFGRIEGAVLVLAYMAYLTWLITGI
ncbi:MAG: calcium/sodium antiporter [Bacteroidaceae bacterium]|nr:calcium/sodium antiporter [Bacteroidaceae bacterium]